MGEAKRRKAIDPNYGKPITKVMIVDGREVRCVPYIGVLYIEKDTPLKFNFHFFSDCNDDEKYIISRLIFVTGMNKIVADKNTEFTFTVMFDKGRNSSFFMLSSVIPGFRSNYSEESFSKALATSFTEPIPVDGMDFFYNNFTDSFERVQFIVR